MYERFSASARRVMQLANREAQRFNHEYIGTEHVLLGLIQVAGVATDVLHNLDIDLRRIRLEVEKLIQRGSYRVTMGKLPTTPAAKRAIEYAMEEAAMEEAWKLKHNQVDTEHFLLGIMREDGGVAGQILMNLGLRIEEARKEIEKVLRESHDLEQKPSAAHPPPSCPKCGQPLIRVVWGDYSLSNKDLEEIKSGQALLGSFKGDNKGPPWVCLECAPKWSEAHHLAMQDYELQLEKENAVAAMEFEKGAQCRDLQEELRRRLRLLYEELSRDE
jgi:ATP-dependent Clp protease ATP-binding subunit ClpA